MSYVSPQRLLKFWEDAKTWIAGKYAPKMRFDPTPVYSVTLAEDVEISTSSDYSIDLSESYDYLWVVADLPSALSANCLMQFIAADAFITSVLRTASTRAVTYIAPILGGKMSLLYGGNATNASKVIYTLESVPAINIGPFTSISLWTATGTLTLQTGMTITIYGIQEV